MFTSEKFASRGIIFDRRQRQNTVKTSDSEYQQSLRFLSL